MMRRLWIAGFALAAAATVARADDEPPPASVNAGATAPTPASNVPTAAEGEWVGALIDLPWALPKGHFGVYGDLALFSQTPPAPMGFPTKTYTAFGMHFGGAYGIIDQLSAGLDYFFPLVGDNTDKTRFIGPLQLFATYQIFHRPNMSLAASLAFIADLCGTLDANGNCGATKALDVGAGFKYQVIPKLVLFSSGGHIGVLGGRAALPPVPFGPGVAGEQLAFSLESRGPITFALPVGVGYQATPQIFAYLDTELAVFYLANPPMNGAAEVIGTDSKTGGLGVPLAVGGFYSIKNALDAGLYLDFPDLANAGNIYVIGLAGRWHH